MKVSVVIPVYNERQHLPQTLRKLRETSRTSPIEIIVVDGGSTDNSLALAQGWADVVLSVPCRGRATQMQEGAKATSGDVLLFLHADTQLPQDWQNSLAQAWQAKPKPVATAFKLGFDSDHWFYRIISHAAHVRTLLTSVPHGDQAIAVERSVYFSVGGFPAVPLMEEYYLFSKLKKLGRVKILDAFVRTSCRRYEKNGLLFNNLRNLGLVLMHYLGVPAQVLAKLYR